MPLPLVYYNDPLLRKKSKPIEAITPEIKQLAEEMVETMIYHNGVGLAAPQVGVLLRIFVIRDELMGENGGYKLGDPEVLINPQLTIPSQEMEVMAEGCLSIPGIHVELARPSQIKVRYQTLEGHIREETASHFRARVIMHENDHINGVLFIDRLPLNLRNKVAPLLQEIKKKYPQKSNEA